MKEFHLRVLLALLWVPIADVLRMLYDSGECCVRSQRPFGRRAAARKGQFMALSTKTMRGLIRYLPGTGNSKGAAVPRLIVHPDDITPVYEPFYIRPTEVPSGTLAEGAIWFDDDNHTIAFFDGTENREVVSVPDGTGNIFPYTYTALLLADQVDMQGIIAPAAMQLVSASFICKTPESAGTLNIQLTRCQGVEAAASGDVLLSNNTSAGFNAVCTAQTLEAGVIITTANVHQFAAGNRLGIDYTGDTAGELVGVTITTWWKFI